MRLDPPSPLLAQTTSGAESTPSNGVETVEVRRQPGLTYSYVARDAMGQELWRYPRESVFTVSLSEKPPGSLINIKA